VAKPNFENRTLYHGDNLDFLRGMNSESVHLIATGPPFNKARDFHAMPGSAAAGARFQDRWSWKKDVHQEWVDQIQDDWPAVWAVVESTRVASGEGMAAFLCFMGVRLMSLHRVLRKDGSIYLHCDPTASHYLKALMDAVFGQENFRNEIIWHYGLGAGNVKDHFRRKHDNIFLYSKSENYTFNIQRGAISEAQENKYRHTDKKGRYMISYGKKYYLKGGPVLDSVWEIPSISPKAKERTGYPTQKPLALYERIVKASSNPGDWVLDPFCGCATTPLAAERLGRRWVGMELWKRAHEILLHRLRTEQFQGEVRYKNTPPVRTDAILSRPIHENSIKITQV